MVPEKASKEAFKIAIVNFLFHLIDKSTEVDDREWYREMDDIDKLLKRLAGIVRMRKLLRNSREAAQKVVENYLYIVVGEATSGIGDYWSLEYGIQPREIAQMLEKDLDILVGKLLHVVFDADAA